MNIKILRKQILFYLIWTVIFMLIPITVVGLHKITLDTILFAFFISTLLSLLATYFYFRKLNNQAIKRTDLIYYLLPEEEIILTADANLRKGFILLNGSLILTNKHILFIGNEFFNKKKKLLCLPLASIAEKHIIGNQLIVKENVGKEHKLFLEEASNFLEQLNAEHI